MKKIVFLITRSDTIGGAQIHIKDICISLKKDKYIPYVIIGDSNGCYLKQLKNSVGPLGPPWGPEKKKEKLSKPWKSTKII